MLACHPHPPPPHSTLLALLTLLPALGRTSWAPRSWDKVQVDAPVAISTCAPLEVPAGLATVSLTDTHHVGREGRSGAPLAHGGASHVAHWTSHATHGTHRTSHWTTRTHIHHWTIAHAVGHTHVHSTWTHHLRSIWSSHHHWSSWHHHHALHGRCADSGGDAAWLCWRLAVTSGRPTSGGAAPLSKSTGRRFHTYLSVSR